MAIRQEELLVREAAVYRFPEAPYRARAARRRAMRRRRATVGVAVIAVALASLSAVGRGDGATAAPTPASVKVQAGDTLWGLAARHAPAEADIRAYVRAVIELNDLEGPLHPGMRLRVP